MNYVSQRHYERVQKNHRMNEKWYQSIWIVIALVIGIGIIGLIYYDFYYKVPQVQKATCHAIYMQGEPGVYCQ